MQQRRSGVAIIDNIAKASSFVFMLAGSAFFGYLGKPTEMGLAIIAGALGLAFANIDKVSEFSGGGFAAKMKDIVGPMIAKETEPEVEVERTEVTQARSLITEPERKVIKALGNTKYTWRYLSGLAEDVQCSRATISRIVTKLMQQGLVVATDGANGKVWGLTELGRSVLQNIDQANEANKA